MNFKLIILFITYISLFTQNLEADDFSYSLKLYNQGYYDLSIRAFETFYKNYPNSNQKADVVFYIGQASRKEKNLEKAKEYYKQLALDFPNHKRAALGWLLYGEVLVEEKKYEEAAKSLENVKLLYPNSEFVIEAIYRAAKAYAESENYDKSEFLFRSIIHEYPSSNFLSDSKLSLISVLGKTGKVEEQKLLIQRYKSDDSIKNKVLFEEANILFYENDYEEAKSILESVQKKLDKSWQAKANVLLGEIYLRTQKFKEAEQLFKTVVLSENDDYRKQRLADALYLQKKYNSAISIYKNLNDDENLFKLALSYKHIGDLRESIQKLDKINNAPKSHSLIDFSILMQAELLLKTKQLIQLIDFVKKHESKVSDEFIKYQLIKLVAESYETRLEYSLALNHYNRLLISYPLNSLNDELLLRKAKILENDNRKKEAYNVVKELLADFPNSKFLAEVKNLEKRLSSNSQTNLESSIQSLSTLMRDMILSSDKVEQLISLGKIQFNELKNYKSAIINFNSAFSISSKNQHKNESKLYMGLSYLKLAEIENDSSFYKKAKNCFAEILKSKENSEFRFQASKGLIETQLANISNEKVRRAKAIKYYMSFINGNSGHKEIDQIRIKLAEYLYEEKKYDESLAIVKQIKKNDIVNQKLSLLADLYIKKNNINKASDALKELLSSSIDGVLYYNTLVRLVPIEEKLNRLDNAMQLRELLINKFPKLELRYTRNKLIQYYFAKNRVSDAEKLVHSMEENILTNDLVIINEFDLVSHLELLNVAKIYDLKDQNLLALKFYYEFLRFNKDLTLNDDVLLSIAEIHLENSDNKRAIQAFEKISSKYYNYAHVQKSLMVLYYKENDYDRVLALGKEVLSKNKNSKLYQELKKIYMIAGINRSNKINFSVELKSYKSQYPKDYEGQANLILEYGKSERKRKNFDKSIRILDDIIDDYDKTSYVDDAAYYTILNLFTLNMVDKTMDKISDFVEEYPKSELLGDVYNTLGSVYVRATKFEDAIDAYKKALFHTKKDETKKIAYSSLVNVYKNIGLWEPILTTASTFIQLFPTDENVLDFKILIGQAYAALGRGTEAVSYLKALKLEADRDREPEIQYAIADTYFKMKDFNNAVTEFIKIPLLSKKTKLQWVPSALYYAGKSYESLGKVNDAIKMYREIVERPGIDALFKKEAKKQIARLSARN